MKLSYHFKLSPTQFLIMELKIAENLNIKGMLNSTATIEALRFLIPGLPRIDADADIQVEVDYGGQTLPWMKGE